MPVTYMDPPPASTPAIIVDGGGLVDRYLQQTNLYARTGQELRLLNCRSACTMAISLPNACVYPNSVLKFHAAYNANTKEIDTGWSDKLMSMYPPRVRARLGQLERPYKVLYGKELIQLGIRRCK
jgi:hypothetical protein